MNTSHHFHSWRCLGGVVYVVVIIQRTQVKWSTQICCNFPCSEGNLTLVMYALLHVIMTWKTLWEHLECLRGFYFLRNMAWKSFSLVFQSTQCQRALLLTASCCALKGLSGALCRNSHLSFSSHFCCPPRLGVEWNYRPLVIWVLRTLKLKSFMNSQILRTFCSSPYLGTRINAQNCVTGIYYTTNILFFIILLVWLVC